MTISWYLISILLLQGKSADLDHTPDSLDDLKFILRTISDIKNMSLEVETKTRDLQERYRILYMYDLLVSATRS